MKAPRPCTAFAFAAAGLLSACTSNEPPPPPKAPAPAAPATDPHATGLRTPTDAERTRLDELSKKNPPLTPNELARARLDAERRAQGLPPQPTEPPAPSPSPAQP